MLDVQPSRPFVAPGGVVSYGEAWEPRPSIAEDARIRAAIQPLRGKGAKSWRDSALVRSWRVPLGNNVNTATPPPPRSVEGILEARQDAEDEARQVRTESNNRLRYGLRAAAQLYTVHSNVGKCGRCRRVIFGHEAGAALMVHPERGAYFTGLCHCGSVWECPVCAYSIAHGRAEELRELAAAHRATGGGVALLTLTTPHDVGDDLQAMRRHQSWAWSKVQAGAQYKRAKDKIGWVGTVAAREPTHGPNGWHPHIHVLLLTARPLQDPKTGKLGADGQAFLKVVYDRWCNYITVRNPTTGTIYRVPSREHGVTLVPSHKDDYISKMGLADEVTRGSFKTAKERAGHRTAFAILGTIKNELDAGREPSPRDVALWKEYAVAMRGARQLTWSRGLRKRYAIPEQTDMELAEAADALAGAELLVRFTDQFWDRHLRNNYRLRCELLAAATRRGLAGVLPIIDRINGLKVVPF